MASIYDIDREILSCVDDETGEVLDFERLTALQMERTQKVENVACWVKNLASDVASLSAEIDALTKRKKAKETKLNSLKRYLAEVVPDKRFETARAVVTFREYSHLEVDNAKCPKKYMVKSVSFAPDKKTITDIIKGGAKVKGCELVTERKASVK